MLPYTVGTYIGKKRVMNLGTGFYVQPRGIAYLDGAGNLRERSNSIASADFFVDVPLKGKNAGAITAYGVYYWWDFGPNNLRNIGIMNLGDPTSGTSLAGRGNNYPMLGTGNSGYGQLGWLMPWKVNTIQFQPYVLSQMSKFDALNDTMFQFGVGVNMFVSRAQCEGHPRVSKSTDLRPRRKRRKPKGQRAWFSRCTCSSSERGAWRGESARRRLCEQRTGPKGTVPEKGTVPFSCEVTYSLSSITECASRPFRMYDGRLSAEGASRLPPQGTNFYLMLAVALLAGCTGSIGGDGERAINDTVAKSLCVVDTPIRRLTRFEYNRTVRDLLGDTSNPADRASARRGSRRLQQPGRGPHQQ